MESAVSLQTENVFRRFSLTVFGAYAPCYHYRYYRLDHLRAARARDWLGQIREMESAQPTRARSRSHGPGSPGKSAQPDEPGDGDGSAAGVDAAI